MTMQRSPLTPATGCCPCSPATQGWASGCCLALKEGRGGRLQKGMCVNGDSAGGWWGGFAFLRWVHLWWIAAVTEGNCCRGDHHTAAIMGSDLAVRVLLLTQQPQSRHPSSCKRVLSCLLHMGCFHLPVHGLSLPGGHLSTCPLHLHSDIGRVCWLVRGHRAAKKHSVGSRALCSLSSHGYVSMCHFKVVRETEEQMRRREAGNVINPQWEGLWSKRIKDSGKHVKFCCRKGTVNASCQCSLLFIS